MSALLPNERAFNMKKQDTTRAPSSLIALLEAVGRAERLPEPPTSIGGFEPRSRPILPMSALATARDTPKPRIGPKQTQAAENRRKTDVGAALKGARLPLPVVLMSLLEDPTNSSVITWFPDGTQFAVTKIREFTKGLMPRHFGIKTYSAFVRRLQSHGFECRPGNSFVHPGFRRGEWTNCIKIRGDKRSSGRVGRPPSSLQRLPTDVSPQAALPQQQQQRVGQSTAETTTTTPPASPPPFAPLSPAAHPLSPAEDASCSPYDYISQSAVDRATQSVVGAALEALYWDRERTTQQRQKRAQRPAVISPHLAHRTSELIASSVCFGSSGQAKDIIKASLLGRGSLRLRPLSPSGPPAALKIRKREEMASQHQRHLGQSEPQAQRPSSLTATDPDLSMASKAWEGATVAQHQACLSKRRCTKEAELEAREKQVQEERQLLEKERQLLENERHAALLRMALRLSAVPASTK